jgi:hypothetical protein
VPKNVRLWWQTNEQSTFESEFDQRDMGLKEPPKLEQVFDFSLLDELGKR